ncbi:tRNA (adenosine(37)-N6)-threonylcarbamoyltransferase complex ATPase subunit type 1 TsaE [Paenibacillus sp. 7124]|uniref:tRNA threonylcarbamoyladenosine biosynthesis protein TsaE n=1 Tax=Paenibacillus apii TaxID=1850370 RepID=A0A6M1PNP2_9BACL|nr:tRNA (adenosine(37)-N6)-threonylcarbamoyltransferase complex ATPase subunit type 1 TsaE [Paenibacillus apii]NGM84826.1 tRNA (adenosine(37)-N6)-threonylcarbamoyltransferase complex ATPase subunit type 1 TsaE [Paenibacillus apii]NJJ41920.1 tRNA (adenosine(37)-N6)-threonylcarbamoyltransferase complex ATPase subunit type 1 TsaE [Paenibacillus apii]
MENNPEAVFTFRSRSLRETEALAQELASAAEPGWVIGLDGDLGAGKTAFSQSFARHLGVQGIVSSPTFTIIKEYAGRIPLYHMDVYRLSLEEADELGLDEYFFGQGICLVEWSSIIAELMPERHMHIRLETTGPEERVITVAGTGEPYAGVCRGLIQKWG